MTKLLSDTQIDSLSEKEFTAEDRLYWAAQLKCTIIELIKAESKVGANPELISNYLNEKQSK